MKKYLNQLYDLRRQITNKEYALQELEQAMRYRSPNFGDDGIKGSVDKNKMDAMTNKVIELRNDIEALNRKFEEVKKDMVGVIMKVSIDHPLEGSILLSRYVNLKSVKRITRELHYSRTQIWNLEKKGQEYLKEYLLKDE